MKGEDRRGKDVAIPPEKSRLECGDAQHAVKDDLHEGPTCVMRAPGAGGTIVRGRQYGCIDAATSKGEIIEDFSAPPRAVSRPPGPLLHRPQRRARPQVQHLPVK